MNWQSVFAMLAFAAILPGCDLDAPDIQALCSKREGCLGGNDKDVDACVVAFEGARSNADDIGCVEEYDALLECMTPQLVCADVGACMTDDDCNGSACIDGTCKRYGLDTDNQDACEQESNAYWRCD